MVKTYPRILGTAFELGSQKVPARDILREFKPDERERERYIAKYKMGELIISRFQSPEEFEEATARVIKEAISQSGINPSEINHVYSALALPIEKRFLPGFARDSAELAGLDGIATVDIGRGCMAALQGLQAAKDRADYWSKRNEPYAAIILTGENTSAAINPKDQSTAPIFSSATAALVVANFGEGTHSIEEVEYRNLSREDLRKAGVPEGDMKRMIDSMVVLNPFITGAKEYFQMEGERVYGFAVRNALPIGLSLIGLDRLPNGAYLIPHQPAPKTLDTLVTSNRLNPKDVYTEGARTMGNTSSATIIIGLHHVRQDPTLRKRDIYLLPFGSGPTAGIGHLRAIRE